MREWCLAYLEPAGETVTNEPDTETLRRLEAFQELHKCPRCGKRPRLQTSLAARWLEGELEFTAVKACDCPSA